HSAPARAGIRIARRTASAIRWKLSSLSEKPILLSQLTAWMQRRQPFDSGEPGREVGTLGADSHQAYPGRDIGAVKHLLKTRREDAPQPRRRVGSGPVVDVLRAVRGCAGPLQLGIEFLPAGDDFHEALHTRKKARH